VHATTAIHQRRFSVRKIAGFYSRRADIMTSMGTDGRGAWSRRLLVSAATLLVLALVAEIVARIADARTDFRSTLLSAYLAMETSGKPVSAGRLELPPAPAVLVRVPVTDEGAPVAYVVGGRSIEDARPSVHHRAVLPADLARDARRPVFVVGESAGFGFPYAYSQSFSALLNERLRPKGITVLNASQVGATSADLAPIVGRIVDNFGPVALVLFIGNNEWIQWTPPQDTPIAPARIHLLRNLALSRALAAVEYASLQRTVRGAATGDFQIHAEIAGHGEALRHPADERGFDAASWATTKSEFLAVFEANLEGMVRAAQARGIRVILLTVPFNPKLSPAWKHPQPESFDPAHATEVRAAIRSAASLVEAGRFDEALPMIEKALALDPLPPIIHYLHGEALEGAGRFEEAERAYASSRENMIGNLGSRLSVNETIRRVAAGTHAQLVDVEKLFEDHEHAQGRFFNADLIHDDCHPTPLGHRLIADAIGSLF